MRADDLHTSEGTLLSSFDSLFASFDPDPNRRGRQFEFLCRWLLLNDPVYRRQIRHVWMWDDWPGRWGADAGIDLVAETQDGKLWAIQAKAYNPSYSVKKADVDSFLSESGREEFSYRLLIATTDKIAVNATRAMRGQEKLTGQLMLSDLRRSEVVWPVSIDDLRSEPARPKEPLPHQQEAIEAALMGFQASDRGQLIMACGTGKTLVSLWIAEALETQRTLVLVPSLSLLRQTIREWLVNTNREFSYLPVCSDDTVRGRDSMVEHVSDLGFPATSDAEEIASFLKQPGPSVVFSTYQSSSAVALAMCGVDEDFDLVLADEAHRCAGPVSSDFATVLDADLIRRQKCLFMTATPRYFTGRIRREAKEADFEIASMDDEEKFGTVLHRLSFGEAIDRKLLSDYRVVIVGVDDTLYRQYAEGGRFVTRDGIEITDARSLAAQIGLAKAQRDYDLRRTITFHGRVKAAKEFADSFPEVIQWIPGQDRPGGRVWTDHVHGNMNTSQRESRLDRMRHQRPDERSVLSNARCLSEGVDVPTLDGVAFIDPKRSEVDIVQAVGRAIRASDDKTFGTIVIPVFIEPTDDPEVALNTSQYKPIWDVVKALRGHDEQLGVELDELRRGLARSRDLHIPAKITLDLPERIGEGFARSFKTVLVERTTSNWEYWFGLLQSHVEHHGDARVLKEHAGSLGKWVVRQRTAYRKTQLERRQVQLLESLAGWTWDPFGEDWEAGFRSLCNFCAKNRHASVPSQHIEEGYHLGTWVSNQRSNYRASRLDPSRVERLNKVDGWAWQILDRNWEAAFSALTAFRKREGHLTVPQGHRESGVALAAWVVNQRKKHISGSLPSEYVARLSSVPDWSWVPLQDAWEASYERLQDYADQHGHVRIPKEGGTEQLFQWAATQRKAFRDGRLSRQRVMRLEAVVGWTFDRADTWTIGYDSLRSFVEREGHSRVQIKHMEGRVSLGNWVSTQRSAYRSGKLESGRVEMLSAIPQWTWLTFAEETWESGFSELTSYARREKHANVPLKHTEGEHNLGSWVVIQRKKYRDGTLNQRQIQLLEGIEGWSWDPVNDRWEANFKLLLQYVQREGGAGVPSNHMEDGVGLGAWVTNIREAYRKGRLDEDQAKRLSAVVGWSWNTSVDRWEEFFVLLTEFAEREGHTRVPLNATEASQKLGAWVGQQRKRYSQSRLGGSRAKRLAALPGWSWDTRNTRWDEGYAQLAHFEQREGHCRVARKHNEDGFPLGTWVGDQRKSWRQGRLGKERTHLLEALGGWTWDVSADWWEQGFAYLTVYVAREGHALVPSAHVEDGFKLGQWVVSQRSRTGELTQSQTDRLQRTSGWAWNSNDAAWEKGYTHLLSFVARERHSRVPFRHKEDGFPLQSWVSNQRANRKNGLLASDRVSRLEKVESWAWDVAEENWTQMCERVRRFAEREGHTDVPYRHQEDGKRLAPWIRTQRGQYDLGSLSMRRQQQLQSIAEWRWNPEVGKSPGDES